MPSPPPDPIDGSSADLVVGYLARDLFFGVRLAEGLRKVGLQAHAIEGSARERASQERRHLARLPLPGPVETPELRPADRAANPGPATFEPAQFALVLVDLTTPPERWRPIIEAAHAGGTPVLAFGSHMDQQRWQIARAAGATRIVANSQLIERFPELVQGLLRSQSQGADE